MSAGRAARAAVIAALACCDRGSGRLGATPPTEVTGAHAAGPHTVRVLVRAAGDLATSDIEADLGRPVRLRRGHPPRGTGAAY